MADNFNFGIGVNRVVSILERILMSAALLLALVYIGDYISVRYRIPRSRDPYGVVPIQRYYAVTKKDGKPDFYFDQPTLQVCVHSLFPHLGYLPCWYLNRRRVQRVDI
jgi:hypothetical protein